MAAPARWRKSLIGPTTASVSHAPFRCEYIPFYDREDPDSAERALAALREVIARDGDRMAAFIVELVQGEAGFRDRAA